MIHHERTKGVPTASFGQVFDEVVAERRISERLALHVPPDSIAARLKASGHEAWIAGGAVRDHLLGREPHDVDVATSATPNEVQALWPDAQLVGVNVSARDLQLGDALVQHIAQKAPEEEVWASSLYSFESRVPS